jgi:uncharacterized radical SAM superfamily Fe-S cluster-containing enzyme
MILMTEEIIRRTTSICPECLQPITAEIYVDDNTNWVMMRKNCEDHGDFKNINGNKHLQMRLVLQYLILPNLNMYLRE